MPVKESTPPVPATSFALYRVATRSVRVWAISLAEATASHIPSAAQTIGSAVLGLRSCCKTASKPAHDAFTQFCRHDGVDLASEPIHPEVSYLSSTGFSVQTVERQEALASRTIGSLR